MHITHARGLVGIGEEIPSLIAEITVKTVRVDAQLWLIGAVMPHMEAKLWSGRVYNTKPIDSV